MLLFAQMSLDWLEKLMNHLRKSKERVNNLSHKKSLVLIKKEKAWFVKKCQVGKTGCFSLKR